VDFPQFMRKNMKRNYISIFSIASLFIALSGCATVAEKTNMLSDDSIKSSTSGVLGYQPGDLTITDRHTDGTNTYVNLIAANKKEYSCVINGGNMLSFGMMNPPQCAKKGDPISAMPFH
jgi:hypothetical protein